MKGYWLFILILLAQVGDFQDIYSGLQAVMSTSDGTSYVVYRNGKPIPLFDSNNIEGGESCTPPMLVNIKGQTQTGESAIEDIVVTNNGLEVLELTSIYTRATLDGTDVFADIKQTSASEILLPSDLQTFQLFQTCPALIDEKNYWSPVVVQLTYNDKYVLDFSFEVSCDASFRQSDFDWSLVILIVLSVIFVTLISQFNKIYSLTISTTNEHVEQLFQGFTIDVKILGIYLTLYFIICLLCVYFSEIMKQVTLVLMIIIALFAVWFFFNEILCLSSRGSLLKKPLCWIVRICDLVSMVIALGLLVGYTLTRKGWYINDIIALCIIGSGVKLFKIKSLRDACFVNPNLIHFLKFLIPCALLDILVAVIIHYTQEESYNILTLKYFNYPVELELPLLSLQYQRKCSWISIISIMLPGFFIGYCYRFDKNSGGYIYTLLSFFALLLGDIIWLSVEVNNSHQWPQSSFTYWLILGLPTLWAQKRGELRTFWYGSFFDTYLQRNYRINSFFGEITRFSNIILNQQQEIRNLTKLSLVRRSDNEDKKYVIDETAFQGLAASPMDNALYDPLNVNGEDIRMASSIEVKRVRIASNSAL